MINGEYKNWRKKGNDSILKVEKSHHTSDKKEDKTTSIINDIDEYSEEESDTEEIYYQDNSYTEYYTWDPNIDNTVTMNSDGELEITLTYVKRKIIGYNKKGILEEEKPKPKIIKIV